MVAGSLSGQSVVAEVKAIDQALVVLPPSRRRNAGSGAWHSRSSVAPGEPTAKRTRCWSARRSKSGHHLNRSGRRIAVELDAPAVFSTKKGVAPSGADEHRVSLKDERGKAMSPKRVQSSAKLALLSAAVLLLVTACGEEKSEPANQGTAPTTQGSAPSTEQPAAPEAGQTAPKQ
jgi:hypothetical protein